MVQNNKGFMLVEVIVTSTVVLTALIGLYTGFNKMYNNYRTKNSYYDIDGIYAIKEMLNVMMLEDGDDNFNKIISDALYYSNYYFIIEEDNDGDNTNDCKINSNVCNGIRDLYNVKNMIIIEYDKAILEQYLSQSLTSADDIFVNATFKEYVNYLIDYYGIVAGDNNYSYLVLAEIVDDGNITYANLRVR